MHSQIVAVLLAVIAATAPAHAAAPAPASSPAPAATPAAAVATAPPACCTLPDGMRVRLEFDEPVTSKFARRGDRFRLRLRSPLVVDGRTVVPAGTRAVGEVVHAERARSAGKPGELILAARHLELDGMQVPLRGMKLGAAGEDNSDQAMAVAVAAGVFAFFVQGGEYTVPPGTRAEAKVAASTVVAPADAASVAAAPPEHQAPPPVQGPHPASTKD